MTVPTASWHRSWRAGEAVRRLREVAGEEGIEAAWFRVLGELCYRRMWITLDRFERELEIDTGSLPVEVSFLTSDEIEEYHELAPTGEPADTQGLLASGHYCALGRVGGELACYSWSASAHAWIEYLDLRIELTEGLLYGHDTYVRPSYRRQRVASALIVQSRGRLVEMGFTGELGAIVPENRAGIGIARSQRSFIGLLRCLEVGTWRRSWLHWDPAARAQPPFSISARHSS